MLDNESKMLSYVDQFFRSRSYSRETERSYSWMLFQLARQSDVDPQIFLGLHTGKRLTGSGLRKMFQRLATRAGLPALSPHDLRRTFCCLMLQGKASTRLVQIAGRWKDIAMVERYSQALRPEDIEPFSVVNRIMEI